MHGGYVITTLVLTSFTALALNAQDGQEEPSEAVSAPGTEFSRSGPGSSCLDDSDCGGALVCDAYCPVIPGRVHCDAVGGTCEPRCEETGSSLKGKTFTSADGAHSITFTSSTTYQKTDGCPNTGGIHCNHIVLSTGTFFATGEKVLLTSDQGAHDTLTVEPHCYDGLLDEQDGVELYP